MVTIDGVAIGVESRIRTLFDVGLEGVTGTTRADCADPILGLFGSELPVDSAPFPPLAATLGNGTAGSMLIESHLPIPMTRPGVAVRAFVVVESILGVDALVAGEMGAPLLLSPFPASVPSGGAPGFFSLLLLAVLIGVAGIRRLAFSRTMAIGIVAVSILSITAPASVRALFGEGSHRVWNLEERVGLDAQGDAPPGIDLLAFYATIDPLTRELWLRFDVLFAAPVCLDWGRIDPGMGYSCNQEPPLDPGPFGGAVALTFDDGPNLATTPGVVELLRSHAIPATFFVVGSRLVTPAEQALVLDLHQDPLFRIANHSLDHLRLRGAPPEEVEYQVVTTTDRIREAIGDPCYFPRYFRFPFGHSDCGSMEIVRSHGLGVVGVNIDPADWCFGAGNGTCAESLVPSIPEEFRSDLSGWVVQRYHEKGGGVVLLHDIHPNTLSELAAIIAGLESAGARFVDLEDLTLFPQLNAAVQSPEPPACCEDRIH